MREEIMNVYIYRDMKRERESIVHTCTIYMNVYLLSFQKKDLFWARALTFIIILLSCANPVCIPRYLSQVILTVKWHWLAAAVFQCTAMMYLLSFIIIYIHLFDTVSVNMETLCFCALDKYLYWHQVFHTRIQDAFWQCLLCLPWSW